MQDDTGGIEIEVLVSLGSKKQDYFHEQPGTSSFFGGEFFPPHEPSVLKQVLELCKNCTVCLSRYMEGSVVWFLLLCFPVLKKFAS